MHKQLEKDSRKHSQPDEKVVLGVMRCVPEGAEHQETGREAREELKGLCGTRAGRGKIPSSSIQGGGPFKEGLMIGQGSGAPLAAESGS